MKRVSAQAAELKCRARCDLPTWMRVLRATVTADSSLGVSCLLFFLNGCNILLSIQPFAGAVLWGKAESRSALQYLSLPSASPCFPGCRGCGTWERSRPQTPCSSHCCCSTKEISRSSVLQGLCVHYLTSFQQLAVPSATVCKDPAPSLSPPQAPDTQAV